jgi:hypothetical protein
VGEWHTGRPYGRRVTVDEAARVLGLSVDAVRKRVQRDTIRYEKDSAGRVRIILDESETLQDEVQGTTGPHQDELLASKDETIRLLREQLEQANERDRENRRIIAALTSRIPELEAPPTNAPQSTWQRLSEEPPEAPPEATEQPGRVARQAQVEGAQEPRESHGMAMPEAGGGPLPHDQQTPSERPWWRRMFGG